MAPSGFVIAESCVSPGIDNSDEIGFVQHAQGIAERSGSHVVLVHVVPEPSEALLHHAVAHSRRPLSRERAAIDLARLARRSPVPSSTSVMVGKADKCIGWHVEHSVDLVLASRGSRPFQAAYSHEPPGISGRLHCPVLTIPIDARISAKSIDEAGARVYRQNVVEADDIGNATTTRRRLEVGSEMLIERRQPSRTQP